MTTPTAPSAAPTPGLMPQGKPLATEPSPATPMPPRTADDDMVHVVQLRAYLGAEDRRVIDTKPYAVTRRRSNELIARGLARMADEADHRATYEAEMKPLADEVPAKPIKKV